MKKSAAFLFVILFLVSCGNGAEKKVVRIEKHLQFEDGNKVSANRQLAIELEGMSCEHACGGAIRTALLDTKAVQRVSFDFQKDRKTNKTIILFDKTKINADEIVAIIEKINNNQFITHKIESSSYTDQKVKASISESSSGSENLSTLQMSNSNFELPSLVDLLLLFIS